MTDPSPTQIECLVCGAARVVFGTTADATGSCHKCGYTGWTYADDLEWVERRTIANRELARRSPSVERGRPGPGR